MSPNIFHAELLDALQSHSSNQSLTQQSHQALLSLRNVTREYQFDKGLPVFALKGVDLDVYPGEFIAVTGHSGSGKSTLLNVIGLLDDPTNGSVFFQGQNVSRMNEQTRTDFRRNSIGFIFQFFNLIESYTAEENIIFQLRLQGKSSHEAKQKSQEIFALLNLTHKAHFFPRQLSGGEQQRIAIGRAVAKDPLLILADEPTAHLDSENSRIIIELLCQVNRRYGKTILLVTHESEESARAMRQIYFKDGKIAAIQSHGKVSQDDTIEQ